MIGGHGTADAAGRSVRTTCVLLVADSGDDRARVRRQLADLSAADCTVAEAGDGRSALAALASSAVDLVLLDDLLPDLTGLELTSEIRQRLGRAAPPIVLLTVDGAEHDDFGVRALAAGATDVLPKRLVDGPTLHRVLRHAAEHQRLRDELRASERLFRGLAEGSPAFVFRTDAAGRIIYGNARWTEITGQSQREMLAGRWVEALHADDAVRITALIAATREGRDWAGELRVIGRDGALRWLRGKANALHDERGRLLGWVGTLDDVTPSKHAEIALRESEARLAAALDAGRCVAWEWSASSQELRRSSNAVALFGLPVVERADLGLVLARVHPDEREGLQLAIERAAASGGTYACEYRILRPDGTARWVADHGRMQVDESGVLRGAVGIMRDVTAERAAAVERERLLDLAQRARTAAEEASRHKDEFLAMVSHELRSPLNVLAGWLEALERLGDDPTQRARALEVLRRAVRTQTAVVNDLLDASAVAAGTLHVEYRAVELGALVDEMVAALEPAAERRRIRLVRLPAERPLVVRGDPQRLAQVVHSLIDNAVKFSADGGAVDVATLAAPDRALVAVRDAGIGIASDFLPYVFDRFRQASVGTTRRYGGLGIGLTIARHVVELHGGTITAHSAGTGRGATFVVHLPLDTQPPEPAGAPAAGPPPRRVLVVEHDADSREAMRLALAGTGIDACAAGSVREATDLLDRFAPELVVTEIGMPDADGFQLLERVRTYDAVRGVHTPVIAVTGHARAEDERMARAAGFDAHLGKPVAPGTLHEAVVAVWRRLHSGAAEVPALR